MSSPTWRRSTPEALNPKPLTQMPCCTCRQPGLQQEKEGVRPTKQVCDDASVGEGRTLKYHVTAEKFNSAHSFIRRQGFAKDCLMHLRSSVPPGRFQPQFRSLNTRSRSVCYSQHYFGEAPASSSSDEDEAAKPMEEQRLHAAEVSH